MDRDSVPIWIFAPVGRDGPLLARALSARSADVHVVRDAEDVRRAGAENRLGVLVLTSEGMSPEILRTITEHVSRLPRWAELPIILLVDGPNNSVMTLERLQDALPRTKLLVLQRPVRPSAIDSAVEIMRQSRLRQFALRDFIARQETLRRELNHRVKNLLATVQAMYGLTIRASDDLESFNELFQGRLRAMADVHDLLHAGSYTGTSLRQAIESVLRPYGAEDRIRIEDATEIAIGPESAQGIALMMHELATNAAKYGALSTRNGRVLIAIRREGDQVVLEWEEADGPPVEEPTASGYGTTFVTATVGSYGGRVEHDYAPTGLRIRFELPAAALSREIT